MGPHFWIIRRVMSMFKSHVTIAQLFGKSGSHVDLIGLLHNPKQMLN